MKLVLTGAAALALQMGVWAQDDLLYDEIAQRWLQRNEIQEPKGVRDVLQRSFAHLAVGLFDVYLPVGALRDGKATEEARAALIALVDTQRGFAGWAQGKWTPNGAPDKRKDDPLSDWLGGLSAKSFANRQLAGADLAEAAGATEEVRAALEGFRAELRKGGLFGVNRDLAGAPMVLFPRRAEFVEFTCVAGALDPSLRNSAWNEGVTGWLEYQADGIPFLTLEYTASAGPRDFGKGIPVGARNPTALAELVSQAGGRALLAHVYADGLDPALGSGMANALVIDLFGELDTRIDGDVRARTSQSRSIFVPGGNPNGGSLPPSSAESRWRGTKGKDHFVGILAQVQKQSGKKAPTRAEKLGRFELQSDDGSKKELVSAPFLGPKAQRPSPEVFGDYLELVRCYGVAFLHWLRLEGAGKPAESAARFGELLRTLGRVKSDDLPAVLRELYGQPLSADDVHGLFDGPTLEGRFLTWLARKG